MTRVAVIGAGVVGLSTAVKIIEGIADVTVTIIADKFDEETTSDGAGGLFSAISAEGVSKDVSRWFRDSWDHFRQLEGSQDGHIAGISRVTGYYISKDKYAEMPEFHGFYYDLTCMNQQELASIADGKLYKRGWKVTTLMVECRWYLPWLMKRFKEHDGKVQRKCVEDVAELCLDYDVIVNCSGLGSRKLFKDETIYPVRGQVLRVKAPWIKHFYKDEENGDYILPGQQNVVLGATMQARNYNRDVSEDDRQHIMESCLRLVPSLKHAVVDREWVGLRPWREPIRLEIEDILTTRGKSKVIHNYGHGHIGVSLSWGTAKAAASMLQDVLSGQTSKL